VRICTVWTTLERSWQDTWQIALETSFLTRVPVAERSRLRLTVIPVHD
jgi:hypothetical protein